VDVSNKITLWKALILKEHAPDAAIFFGDLLARRKNLYHRLRDGAYSKTPPHMVDPYGPATAS
jgi:hypothetical protein